MLEIHIAASINFKYEIIACSFSGLVDTLFKDLMIH